MIITICGSMKFIDQMQGLKQNLEKSGHKVYLPVISEKSQTSITLSSKALIKQKKIYIQRHFDKIKKSEAILVANYPKNDIDGYIGANTLMEIAYAYGIGKQVFVLNKLGDQGCKEEVEAIATKILDGKLKDIS